MSQTLQCPKCRRETLERVDSYTASGDLSSRPARCERCGGLWLTREELERVEKEPGAVELALEDLPRQADGDQSGERSEVDYVGDADPAAPDDGAREITRIAESPDGADARAGLCPDCHRILVRADVALEETFFLERCAHCGGIWFDAGEWKLLAEHDELRPDLSRLWDPHYRRERLERQNREAYLERLKEHLGADLFERIESVAADLDDHEHKGAGVAFLFERLGIPHPEWDTEPVAHEASVEVEELGDLD